MLLTMKEVAEYLRISMSLTYRLVASGEIPCYEIASCKRVDKEELNAYLASLRQKTTKPPKILKKHF